MPWTPPGFSSFVWSDFPSLATALDAANLNAEEANQAADTRTVVAALDAYLEALINALPGAAPTVIAAGNISGTYTPTLGPLNTEITATLTGDTMLSIAGIAAGGAVRFLGTQNGSGGNHLSVTNGVITQTVSIPTAPSASFAVDLYSPDGSTLFIQPPSPTVATLSAATSGLTLGSPYTWTIPPGANMLRYTLWGGYGGSGGGAFPSSSTAGIFGASGGGLPYIVRGLISVGAMTSLAVTLGAGGTAGVGGTSGTPSGTNGGYGGDSTITGTGIGGTITAIGGAKGIGSSNVATVATQAMIWGGKSFNGQTQSVGSVGMGGPSGIGGSAPWLELGGAGGGGGNSSAGIGGGAGGAGTQYAGGSAGVTGGNTGSINGANAANGVTGAPGGGGAGCWNSGTPGNGGNGGTGPGGGCIFEVVG